MYASKKMPTIFRKKLIVMTKFPDISLTWRKFCFFPDFSLEKNLEIRKKVLNDMSINGIQLNERLLWYVFFCQNFFVTIIVP